MRGCVFEIRLERSDGGRLFFFLRVKTHPKIFLFTFFCVKALVSKVEGDSGDKSDPCLVCSIFLHFLELKSVTWPTYCVVFHVSHTILKITRQSGLYHVCPTEG